MASYLQFRLADSITGRLVGQVYPQRWESIDPLTGAASGSMSFALPRETQLVDLLRRTVGVADRVQVACWDPRQGKYLFGGPVPSPATFNPSDGLLTVKWTDWRAWFYTAVLRIGAVNLNTNGDYIQTGYEQMDAMRDLVESALDDPGAPSLSLASYAASGVTRDITFRLFETVGACLDDLSRRERGPEWWTSYLPVDDDALMPVVNFAWPERNSRSDPLRIRVEDQGAKGHNVAERIMWPEQPEARTRVYGTGEGTHPDVVWAVDEDPGLAGGDVLLREEVAGPFTGVVTKETAFDHAFAQRFVLNASGPVEVNMRTDRPDLDPALYDVGDRVNLFAEDRWQRREAGSARIIQRTLSGGRGDEPYLSKLVVDVAGTEATEE